MEPIRINLTDIERKFGITEKRTASCERHGEYSSSFLSRSGKWTDCPDCAKEQQSQREQDEIRRAYEAKQAERLAALFGRAAIPPRFANRTFDGYQAETDAQRHILKVCREYAEQFPERLRDGSCLLLLGNPGTGKTHLATAIASEVIRLHGLAALYSTVTDAIRRIKDNWTTRERPESEIIRMFASPALLVLDEIGIGWGSATELNLLFEIVNARYEAGKPIILAGNIEAAQVRECVGDRVRDRLREGSPKTLIFNWQSARAPMKHDGA